MIPPYDQQPLNRSIREIEYPATPEWNPWEWPHKRTHRPTRRRAPRMELATFTIFAIGTGATGAGTLNPGVPAGTLTSKLMLLCVVSGGTETITTPSGYTLLKQGSLTGCAIFGKIGTGSESAPSVVFSGGAAHAAFIVAITSSTGWPAIGGVLVDSAVGNNSSGSAGWQRYRGCSVTEEGLCGFQFGARNTTSATGTVTAVGVATGWVAAGTAFNNSTNGICASAQMMSTSPTVAGDIPLFDIADGMTAITTNTSNLTRREITVTLKSASAGGYTFDASSKIDSPFTWLPDFLLVPPHNMVAFAAGDTGQQNGTPTPPAAVFTLGNNGYISITFDFPDPTPITIPFIVNDASAGVDHAFALTFNPPPGVVPIPLAFTNVQLAAIGDNELTLSGLVASDTLPVTVYVVVLERGAVPPIGAQIVAGTDANDLPAPSNSAIAAAQGVIEVSVIGLAQEHEYDVWYVAHDAGTGETAPGVLPALTTGSAWPLSVKRKTRVTPITTGQFSMMDDGSIRAVDFTAQRAYEVEIMHDQITLDERSLIDAFVEQFIYGLVDVLAADGHTYRVLLTESLEWSEDSSIRVSGNITLKGHRVS